MTDTLAEPLVFGDVGWSQAQRSCSTGRFVAAVVGGIGAAAVLGALSAVVVFRAVVERRWR